MYIDRQKHNGFTLIELSIVLVIIALLVGGILVGRDLIKAATLRRQITQFQQYQLAAQTFRMKYGNLPGDLSAEKAAGAGFTTRAGDDGHGDGDGIVEGCGSYWEVGCEAALYWRDLSDAKLIKENFITATDSDPTISTAAQSALYYPSSMLGIDKFILVGLDSNDRGWFVLADNFHFDPAAPVTLCM
jgi:prepilin-type N-terminal cleavage/methylation domain-containing protein